MNTLNHETSAWNRTIILVTIKGKSIYKIFVKFIYSFSWIRCFFGPIIRLFLFSVRFVRICDIFCDFNDRNTVKSRNILAPRLFFHGELQRYTTFIELYTFLDKDVSTLIENGNSFQFSHAVCAKSTGKLTCFKPREISIMSISL